MLIFPGKGPKRPLPGWWDLQHRPKQGLHLEQKKNTWIIEGSSNADRIWIGKGTDGKLDVYLNGFYQGSVKEDEINKIIIKGGMGNDRIEVDSEIMKNVTIYGGDGNDYIKGGNGHDRLEGGKGNDRIDGGGGNDAIFGRSGNDVLEGGMGNDRLYGEKGNDKIFGQEGCDFLDGGKGNDLLNSIDQQNSSSAGGDFIHDYKGENEFVLDDNDTVTRSKETGQTKSLKDTLEKEYGIKIGNSKKRGWSYEDLKQLENFLKNLHPSLKQAIQGYTFRRVVYKNEGGIDSAGDHFSGEKVIRVFDAAPISNGMRMVLLHETAHAFQSKIMTKDQRRQFNQISWEKVDGEWQKKNETSFVREYGMTNRKEDWATSVEAYFFNPDRLKAVSPEKYNFINNLFGIKVSLRGPLFVNDGSIVQTTKYKYLYA